ncbi:hypothetical protein ACOSP7_028465 [Xanthoceras sorbifolium]
MSSLSDWRCHKASINSPSNKRGRKLRSFDDALIDYERFVFEKRTGHRGDTAVAACSLEVVGTAVRGDRREFAEMSSFRDHGEREGVLLGIEERDDSFLAVSGGLDAETGSSSFPSSGITKEILVELVYTFHLFRGHKVLIHSEKYLEVREVVH